jgi:replicative DNA helicase
MIQRVPPHNFDAEQSVLGSLLLDEAAWDEVVDQLREEDFYKPAHKIIFRAVYELKKKNLPSDLVTLTNELIGSGNLDSVGGPAYLGELLESIPSTANLSSHLRIVKDKALLRKIISTSQGFIERAYSQDFDTVENFLDNIEGEVFKVAEQKNVSGLVDASELVRMSIEKIEQMAANKLKITGLATGFAELDDMTTGLQPGEMTVIAARPSMGKTAFSLNIALHAALIEKKKVAYFSVEMGKESVMVRLLASAARVPLSSIKTGLLDDRGWPRLIEKAAALSETGLFIDDTAGVSPFEIRAKCRRLKAKYGLDIIMIDYLQLMDLKQKVEGRQQEVSEISKLLKSIAKELQVPVIALAQLNRGVEGRNDKRPMLSDLRESGSIEQDADIIMMLYREDYYNRDNPDIKGIAEVIVGKHRNGPTGTVRLRWRPEFGLFENLITGPDAPMPEAPFSRQGPGGGGRNRPAPTSPPPNLAPGSA